MFVLPLSAEARPTHGTEKSRSCTSQLRILAEQVRASSPESFLLDSRLHPRRGEITRCFNTTHEESYNSPRAMYDWLNLSAARIDQGFSAFEPQEQRVALGALEAMNAREHACTVLHASESARTKLHEALSQLVGARIYDKNQASFTPGGLYDRVRNLGFLKERFQTDYIAAQPVAQDSAEKAAQCQAVAKKRLQIEATFAKAEEACASLTQEKHEVFRAALEKESALHQSCRRARSEAKYRAWKEDMEDDFALYRLRQGTGSAQ